MKTLCDSDTRFSVHLVNGSRFVNRREEALRTSGLLSDKYSGSKQRGSVFHVSAMPDHHQASWTTVRGIRISDRTRTVGQTQTRPAHANHQSLDLYAHDPGIHIALANGHLYAERVLLLRDAGAHCVREHTPRKQVAERQSVSEAAE